MWHQGWRETLNPGAMSTRSRNLENESAKIMSKTRAAVVFAYTGTQMLTDKAGTLEALIAPPTNLIHTAFWLISKHLVKVHHTARPSMLPQGPFPFGSEILSCGRFKAIGSSQGCHRTFLEQAARVAAQSNPNVISISVTFHRKRKLLSPK